MAVDTGFESDSLTAPSNDAAQFSPDKNRLFLRLFLQNQHRLYAYILTLLPHRADADDVLQEASMTMWDKFDANAPPTEFLAWARRVAYHKVLDFYKKTNRAQTRLSQLFVERLAESAAAQSDGLQLDARREALAGCIEKLPPRDRDLLTHRFAAGAHAIHLRTTRPVRRCRLQGTRETSRRAAPVRPEDTHAGGPSMSPESPIIAELHPLLDALCEETITPEQLRRLEELVLAHPETEAFYIQFMSLHADLISHVAGLPEPKPIQEAKSEPESELPAVQPEQPTAEPAPQKSVAKKSPKSREGRRYGKVIAWLLVVGVVGTIIGYPILDWRSRSRAVRDADATVQAHRAKLALVQAEEAAARQASRKDVDAALAVEAELAKQFAEARETARKAIEEKDFVVRLTGPAHIQPGAPNKWQIETLRHGAIGRPKRMDVIVKDGKDHELFRQTHDKPVGAATLELSPAFWSQVKPGTELFLEVVAYTNDDRKSVLADRLPLGRPVYVTHLVTDKPLYKPGETIRFRSLTLDRSTLLPPEHDLHLLFKLSDPANSVIPLDEGNGRLLSSLKPVLGPDNKPLRGIGVGEYTLPIDAPGGEYKLDLFEVNAETKTTVRLESRKFIVNRYVPDIFEKKLEFDGKSYGPGEYVQARIEVSRTAGGAMKNAKANVVAAIGGQPIHEQKDAVFTTITDASGIKTVLDVRFKLPADLFEKAKDAPPSATLSVNIQDGSDAEAIVRPR